MRLLLVATGYVLVSDILICLHYIALLSYVSIGRFLYSPDLRKPQQLGGGLESWCGFYQSIRPTQMGLSLNIGEVLPYLLHVFFLLFEDF